MAEEPLHEEYFVDESDAPLRNRRANSKALKTLGVDTSARKQRKVLGLDDTQYHKALKEAAESIDEPLAGGHEIEIPDEQIEAQLHARRHRRRHSSASSRVHHRRQRRSREHSAAPSSDNVGLDPNDESDVMESDSLPSYDYSSDNEPFSDGAARLGRRGTQALELEEEDDDLNLDKRRWRSPSARGLIDEDHEDGPLSTSAPNRYFYYYYDGARQQPRRRRASFACDSTPMIDKRANRKALSILGINPSEEKVMEILGIDEPEELQSAVASSLAHEIDPELPQGRSLQPKALSTLGVPPQPSKADILLGRYDIAPSERTMMNILLDLHMDAPFI